MSDKDFFSKLAGVGPDGKFSNFSQKKNYSNLGNDGNGRGDYQNEKNNIVEDKSDMGKQNENTESSNEPEGQLAVDVYQTPSAFVVESAIAGVKGEDVDVSITIDSVQIRGKRSKEDKDSDKEYLCQECFWGRFARTIILPQEVDADRSVASFKNGILRIILPKILRDKPKKLRVRFD